MKIQTSVTRLLGIDLPILQAGMSWASSNAALPLAVSEAGGLGVIGAGPMRIAALAEAIDSVRAGTSKPFAVNVPLYREGSEEILDLVAERRVPVLVASQGSPKKYLARFHAQGTICLHVVATEEHAQKAAAAGVDAVIVVGGEAGGHPPPELVSTLVNLRAVVRALNGAVPIIAAGGFVDGAGLAAALSLGAGAVSFGTRFMATEESNLHPAYKQSLLDASTRDTRAVGRDLGMIRALRNTFTDRMMDAELTGLSLEERKTLFATGSLRMAALDGDVANGKVEAGQSVGLIEDLLPAGDLVRRIAEEYAAARAGLPPAEQN